MDFKFRDIFLQTCQKAGFSKKQIEELEKKVVENALEFALAKIYEEMGQRIKKEELVKLKSKYEGEVNIKSMAFSAKEVLEYVRRVFKKYMKEEDIERITGDAFQNEYSLTTNKILELK